ncbi:hypothetical protein D3C85_1445310 [compost metagenome]
MQLAALHQRILAIVDFGQHGMACTLKQRPKTIANDGQMVHEQHSAHAFFPMSRFLCPSIDQGNNRESLLQPR